MRRWYAVFAKPGREAVAEANLIRQDFRPYLPRVPASKRGGGRAPLFPRYLFVELDVEAGPWRAVNSTFGVIGLVQFGPRPSPVPHGVVEAIMEREGPDGLVQLPKQVPFQPGDRVSVEDGPLLARIGVFDGMAAAGRARVLMDLLGGKISVQVPAAVLRKAG